MLSGLVPTLESPLALEGVVAAVGEAGASRDW